MFEPKNSPPLEETVVIVGVGLIGGSLAAAMKRRNAARRVIGIGRDSARIEAAQAAGLIDEAFTDIASVVSRANLIVFCTPVDRVVQDVRAAVEAIKNARQQSSGMFSPLMTDVGSVKGLICEKLSHLKNFIGSHPIAGSHRNGFEAADANLFEGRICVITPLPSAPDSDIDRLNQFWQAVGMQTVRMSPVAHDQALAMTSHLPHVVASALAMTLSENNRSLTGSGFRDTTRVAAGDPDLWTGILLNNSDHVIEGIDEMQKQLLAFRQAISAGSTDSIRSLLAQGQRMRVNLDHRQRGLEQDLTD